MLFNTWTFALFFALVYLVYLQLGHTAQNRFALLASYLFYAAWDWRFLGLIVVSTLVDHRCGRRVHALREADPQQAKRWVALSVTVNLLLLGVFKYCDFFVGSLAALLGALGFEPHLPLLGVAVPVGISFYTFQTISYTVDLQRGTLERPCQSLLDFALFVAFFPQLVAGPIERAAQLLPQIECPRVLTAAAVRQGAWWILWGYVLKVYMADNLAVLVDPVFQAEGRLGAAQALLGVWAFAFQIYGDFAGYSLIARGLAKLLGFDLMQNFDVPYVAADPREFWRRWHISLSSWLRDYLYLPLGGNRGSRARTHRNLALVMLLGGLWHGAAWTFVLWGAWHGALLIAYRLDAEQRQAKGLDPAPGGAQGLFRRVLFFHLVCVGWILFRADSLAGVGKVLGAIVSADVFRWPGADREGLLLFLLLIAPTLALDALQVRRGDPDAPLTWPAWARWLWVAVLLALLALFGARGGEAFIYFQF